LTEGEFNDATFRAACRKYDEVQNMSLDIRMLRAAMTAVEGQIYYLQHFEFRSKYCLGVIPLF